ncbi:MAG: Lrp/AsnC family transcriptional regulator [Brevundimonas sp.]|jgi:Lrp/AsnC family transcriptional regulator|nr:Lrp/AsnC family transcriptional regulator [Brevundimonas sp.]MCZ8322789.1 Lrp/AsnC family transcriptional regulator [Novosphingobium sp.]
MDEVDLRLLRAIQSEPDLAVADLARLAGLSQTPAWRRLKRLQDEGLISGRAVLLDAGKLGLTVNVFAYIRLKHHDEETLESLEREVQHHPEIVECFSMSGDSDYVMRIMVRSVEDYEKFLKRVLLHLPGVAYINSSFSLNRVKLTTKIPL